MATYALIVAQVVAWLVVRRFLLAGNDWTAFAILPGAPRELGLFVSPFVHLEPAHLGVNLAVLWLFGTNLERSTGSLRFVLLYLGAAWFASLMQWATFVSFHLVPDLTHRNAAVGSSGAIAGILGAMLVRLPRARLRLPLLSRVTVPAAPILVAWVLYTVYRALVTTVAGVGEGVGHWAHFAGFVFGLGMAQVSGMPRQAREEYLRETAAAAAAKGNLLLAAQSWSAVLAIRPGDLATRVALVTARMGLGDVPGARRLAREGIEAAVRAGDRAAAMSAYTELAELVPGLELTAGVRYRVGCWLEEAGQSEIAYLALKASAQEETGSAAAAGALYRAGRVALERLHSRRRAREVWERLVELYPESDWSEAGREALRRIPAG